MTDVKTDLQNALKEAMKNKDTLRRNTIRLTQSAIKQVEIDDQKVLSNEEVQALIQKEIKKRQDSIEEYKKAGRTEQAEEEQAEITILQEFLPKQLTEDEIKLIVEQAIEQTNAASMKDMGKVMGKIMPAVKGKADGKLVNQIVREMLDNS